MNLQYDQTYRTEGYNLSTHNSLAPFSVRGGGGGGGGGTKVKCLFQCLGKKNTNS